MFRTKKILRFFAENIDRILVLNMAEVDAHSKYNKIGEMKLAISNSADQNPELN